MDSNLDDLYDKFEQICQLIPVLLKRGIKEEDKIAAFYSFYAIPSGERTIAMLVMVDLIVDYLAYKDNITYDQMIEIMMKSLPAKYKLVVAAGNKASQQETSKNNLN